MDAHLFRIFTKIAVPLLENAVIEKIQQPTGDTSSLNIFALTFYKSGRKEQLILRYERQKPFIYFSPLRFPAKKDPPAFIMRLRKYFAEKRITSVIPQFCQRKLWLMIRTQNNYTDGGLSSKNKIPWLCLDLKTGPSLHFLSIEEIPLQDSPCWPDSTNLSAALANWQDWPVLTPALRNALQYYNKLDQLALLEDLKTGEGDIFYYYNHEHIKKLSAWPLPSSQSKGLSEETGSDIYKIFSKAGADFVSAPFYEKRDSYLTNVQSRKIKHLQRILVNLDQDETRLNKMLKQQDDAIKIKNNLCFIDTNEHTDVFKYPILPDSYAGNNNSNTNKQNVILLDKRFSILENMERFFKNSQRAKRGLKALFDRRRSIQSQLEDLKFQESASQIIKYDNSDTGINSDQKSSQSNNLFIKNLPKNIQGYLSSNGLLLLRGKNAAGNRAIRKMSAPHDLWCHVETGPGAHIIIRKKQPDQIIPEQTLLEAGSLAAVKSWLAASQKASIMFAETRHVKGIKDSQKVSIDKLAFTRLIEIIADIENKLSP